MRIDVRTARLDDDRALVAIDDATWTAATSPAPLPPRDRTFFGERVRPGAVLVAKLHDVVAGYAQLGNSMPIPSHEHVLQLCGLAVDRGYARRGIGRRLVEESIERAIERGAHKLTLRVLGVNTAARALYESCGFEIEGILRDEFWLDGRLVDDVLMAHRLR